MFPIHQHLPFTSYVHVRQGHQLNGIKLCKISVSHQNTTSSSASIANDMLQCGALPQLGSVYKEHFHIQWCSFFDMDCSCL
jgi:hypothetical protein